MSFKAMSRSPSKAQQKGVALIITAAFMLTAVLCLVLVVDTGRLYYEKRSLQRIADMSALDAANRGVLCGSSEQSYVTELATESANRNGFSGDVLTVELGRILKDGDPGYEAGVRTFQASATNIEVVRVHIAKSVPASIVAGGLFGQQVSLQVEAVAGRTPVATISAGTGLLAVDTSKSALLNPLLSGLLGSAVSLDAVSYQGIANADVTLLEILQEGGIVDVGADVGTVDELLETDVGLLQIVSAAAEVLKDKGVVTAAVANMLIAGINDASFQLGEIIDLDTSNPDTVEQLNAKVNALDIIMAAAQVANKNNALALSLNAANLANATLTVIEPMKIAIGSPGRDEAGNWRTEARQAQVRLYADVNTSAGPLGGLGAALLGGDELRLEIESAPGGVWLQEMNCPTLNNRDVSLTLGYEVDAATIKLGSKNSGINSPYMLSILGGTVQIGLRANIAVGGSDGEEVYVVEGDHSNLPLTKRLPTSGQLSDLIGSEPGDASGIYIDPVKTCVPLTGICINASLVGGLLNSVVNVVVTPLINSLLTPILNSLLPLLGVQLGFVDGGVIDVHASGAELLR